MCSNPSEWILEECYPEGFTWADPSKIHKSEVFRLLDHWRQREKDGLTPLIWNPSCEFFDDGEVCSRTIRIKKREKVPSNSSTSSSSDQQSSEKDSEENFQAELAKIPSSDSDTPNSHSSPESPSPSPLPRLSVSRIPEEIGRPLADTPLSIPDRSSRSCKLTVL